MRYYTFKCPIHGEFEVKLDINKDNLIVHDCPMCDGLDMHSPSPRVFQFGCHMWKEGQKPDA